MTPGTIALAIIFTVVFVGAVTGIYAGFRREMNLEQWTVAGRGFGVLFVWLLTAGEVYTTFSFLGASGWAYSRGAPTLYIIAYTTLTNVVGFFMLPRICEAGHRHGLHTESDFFLQRYENKWLAGLVAIVGVIFIIPYLQLQLTGLGIIVQVASYGTITRSLAIFIAFAIVAGFVLSSGIRAVAWVSILKDLLMLSAAFAIGIGVPFHYFGGIRPMFQALVRAHPRHFTMPGSTTTMTHSWYVTTVMLSALGGYMWPQNFGAIFSAKSGETLRRNAIIMPLYVITLPLLLCVGFAAILILPGLKNGDMALLTTVRQTFSPWTLGLIGGAGALTAMVPAAILILTAGTLFAKNFVRPLFAPSMTDNSVTRLAKFMVVVITALAMYFAIYSSSTLVGLLLFAYSGIAQFFPGVFFALYWKRVTTAGVISGLTAGVATAMVLTSTNHDPIFGMNAGFVALCLNFAVTAAVSVARRSQADDLQRASTAFTGTAAR
jgi:solute:Na+ symporter, SSS family